MIAESSASRRRTLLVLLLVMAAGYFLMHDLMGGTLLSHDPRDSYTLQTANWLEGRLYVENGEDYAWLELAIFNGRYYVSFPPLPSVILIPFVLLWGMDTPNNLLIAVYGLIAAALAYRIFLRRNRSPRAAAFWALFTVWGSNMLWMTTNGGVWFQAQALNMVFCLGAVLAAINGRRPLSTTLLALAVGCRPFSAIFLPVFYLWFAWDDRKDGGLLPALFRQWRCLVGPVLVAVTLMGYNFARFGDPLEFGHNYLPEFTRTETGQFHFSYLLPNLKKMFLSFISLEDGQLQFDIFGSFPFYIANPLFLVLFVRQIQSLCRRHITGEGILLSLGILLGLVCLCMHKTLGGWQFGSRYTCDLLPFALLYIADKSPARLSDWELGLGGLAILFNAYGFVYIYIYVYGF